MSKCSTHFMIGVSFGIALWWLNAVVQTLMSDTQSGANRLNLAVNDARLADSFSDTHWTCAEWQTHWASDDTRNL